MTLHTPEAIKEALEKKMEELRPQLIADTQKILQFKTVSGGSPAEEATLKEELPKCFAWLESRANDFGFDYTSFDGIVSEIAWNHQNPDAPVVIIAGHIDVVTPGEGWSQPPFSGVEHEGEIWGRGAQDDKGPVIQGLYAMRALKELGVDTGCSIRLAIGSQEETGDWGDMRKYIETRGAPDFGFTPDAGFPIINGEKGMATLMIEGQWEETGKDPETGMEFISITGGERRNMVPAGCELTLQFDKAERTEVMKELVRTSTSYVVEHDDANVTLLPDKEREVGADRYEGVLTFIGKSGHSSTPQKGHNAILDCLDFVRDIETLPFPVRRFSALMQVFGMDLHGASLGIDQEHPELGPTSNCLVIIEVRKSGGRALFNTRPTQGSGPQDVLKRAKKTLEAYNEKMTDVKLNVSLQSDGMEPLYLDPENERLRPYLHGLKKGFELVTGRVCAFESIGGTTYAKALANTCAFGPTMPEELDLIHQTDERVPVESVVRNAKIFAAALAMIAIEKQDAPE